MAQDIRVKYDVALRRKAADLFGRGLGYHAVSTELGIPRRTAKGWRRRFRATGAEGLLDVGGSQYRYSFETKLAAARAVVEEGATRSEAMACFGVRSEAPISRWVKAYREGGAEALRPKPKGRPRGSGSRVAPMSREQELEREVRRLEAEVAYLKESIALKAELRSRAGRRP
ncbi:helix-turn-helix domain-containing protein [Thermophilibacter provencensis]|uniref:Helix-turn-helix domain-containing protein n=1 Tax=Thermophilibacter provencensis TaxID=1852386 RepID=A0ABT7V0M4_9ACTN|nr:helix-turn-helix domain-containing protein [Thermophilibacter provencensis]MDM8270160.1 helix-turn-helix domain-containing protein [Thermophilibacter provencensis]